MAAGAFTPYGAAIEAIFKGLMDVDGSTFVGTLHSASYTPNADTHDTWSDVSASELATAGNYTQGGEELGSVTVTRSGSTIKVDAADLTFVNLDVEAKWLVVTKRAGGSLASGDLLFGYVELSVGGTVAPENGPLAVTWHADGMMYAEPAA